MCRKLKKKSKSVLEAIESFLFHIFNHPLEIGSVPNKLKIAASH